MKLIEKIKNLLNDFTGLSELSRLSAENEALRQRERTAINYVRSKVNQLLLVMGTLPLRHEELDEKTLLELDPIGIIADSFTHVLEHLNETNEKLQVTRDEIQAILTIAGVGILVVDDRMRIQAYNLKLKELFLKDQSDVIGQTCCSILCGLDCPPADCTFEKIVAMRIGIHRPDWVYRDRHFDVSGTPIKNRYGEINRVVLVYTDITDRKRTEEALRESGEMYGDMFENAGDLIVSIDPDGYFLYANRACCEALGYSREEIACLSLSEVIHPDHRSRCMSQLRQLQAGQKIGRVDAALIAKDGTPVRVDGSLSCGFKGGESAVTCGIFRQLDGSV